MKEFEKVANEFEKIKKELRDIDTREKTNYNKIAQEGKTALENFEEKIQNFDIELLKYRYYSVNFTLLIGNYKALYRTLYKMSIDNFMDINDGVSSELSTILEQTDMNLKVATTMFMQTDYLKWGATLFKECEIK